MGKKNSKLVVDSSLSGVEVTLPQEFSALQLTKALHRKGLLKRKRHGHHQDDPETLLKKLIEELYSRNGNEHSIQELFIITKEMGIFFANLPPVLDEQYQLIQRQTSAHPPPDSGESEVQERKTANCRRVHTFTHSHPSRVDDPKIHHELRPTNTRNIVVSLADVAAKLAEAPLDVIPKRIVAISIDATEDSLADKLLQMTEDNHGKATPLSYKSSFPNPIKIIEHRGHAQASHSAHVDLDASLTEAVLGRTAPSLSIHSMKPVDHTKPKNTGVTLNPSKACWLKEFKINILKALLQEQIPTGESSNRTYPVTLVAKVRNEPLIRDLVAQFLMGPNSVYLLIYNWKDELVVLNENASIDPFNHELLKWMHTIGSNAAVNNCLDEQTISTMLVTTHFDELVSKHGGDRSAARNLAYRQASQVCEVLKSHNNHICADSIDPKPILLGSIEEFEEHSAPQLAKMASDNFTAFKMSPQEIMLLNKLRAPENLPVTSVRMFMQLASDVDMSRREAHRVLKVFTDMRLVFSLPRHTGSALKDVIFTDLDWLVNALFQFLTVPEVTERGPLWSKWQNLLDTGIMSTAIKTHISKLSSNIHHLLPPEWIFELLLQLNLFTPNVGAPRNNNRHFCPLYLPEVRSEKLHNAYHQLDGDIPPLYLRPNTGCVTDQYTMRLFCWILRTEILSLQECQSRTQAIFLSRENHLRFTLSRSLDCLKVTVESSFTGRAPDRNASGVAHYIVSRIVMASQEMGDAWFPIVLTRDTKIVEEWPQLPNLYFQCYCGQVDHPHLAEVVFQPTDSLFISYLECEVCQQASDISDGEKFWTRPFYSTIVAETEGRQGVLRSTHKTVHKSNPAFESFRPIDSKRASSEIALSAPSHDHEGTGRKTGVKQDSLRQKRNQDGDEECAPTATAPIERLHILERHFSSLFDHLGVEIVAIGLMEEKVLSHQEVLQILTYNTFQSTADRSKALIAIISAVKEKGLAPLMHILEQTSNSYAGHWKIMNALQSDPNFVKYL